MSKARLGKRFIPSFDFLEGRTVPAGNITTSFFNGLLRLDGDDAANQIRIVQNDNGVGVTISVLDDDTTIDGASGDKVINATVKTLAVALGDGDDVLEVDGLFLSKDFAVNGNGGDDSITINDVTVKYRGFVFGKDGEDEITITDSNIRRSLWLFAGAGDDSVTFTGNSVGKKSVLHGGDGSDTLDHSGNHFGKKSKILSFNDEDDGGNETTLTANPDTATVARGNTVTINVAANDTAATGETLDPASIVITTPPTNGTVTVNSNGTVTYTNNGSSANTDTFQYTIQDVANHTSSPGTVTVTITGATSAAPVANNDTATVGEGGNTSINVAANDTDSDGTLNLGSIVIFQNPANGTVTVNNNGTVTYTHNGSNTTSDSFQYTIKDNTGTVSNVATVNITVTAVNDAPVAANDSAQTTKGGTVTVSVAANDTDSDGTIDPATIVITQQPANGSVTVNSNGTVTYTHNNSNTTSDTFQYTIKDNTGATSNAATVSILIGTAPVANNDPATLAEGGNTSINVVANDTDSDGTINPATVVITQQPTRGTVTVNANGTVSYTHNGSETTSDSFSYTVKDNQGLVSNAATVNITVTPVNDAPVANNDTLFVAPSGSATFNVSTNDTDAEGALDLASIVITQQPTGGTVTVNNNGTVTYTRSGAGTTGDSFKYTIKDTSGAVSAAATVTVVVDTPPVANNDTATVDEGGTTTINVAANDTDADGTVNATSVVIVQQPTHGLVVVNPSGTINYTHDGSETTSDTFTYTIKDNQGATSNAATVTITVTPVNDAPVAAADTANTTNGGTTTINVAANDTDADGTLNLGSVLVTTQPTNGTVTVNNDGTVSYTHNGSSTTTDSFQYTIKDNAGTTSNAATVTISIAAGNAAPVAANDTALLTPFGQAFINVAANDTDSDGTIDPATITITQQPTNGTVTVNNNGTVTYLNENPQAGGDSFQYTIKDNAGATSNAATVTITVNLAPVANDDQGSVNQGGATSVNVAANDTDVDGTLDLTSVVITQQPANGTVTVNNDGTVSYTNTNSAASSDTFQYTIKDNNGVVSGAATVTITVNSTNNTPPTANGDALAIAPNGNGTVNVLANDHDVDGTLDATTVTITQQPSFGTAVVNADGTVTYTHTGGGAGFDSFKYTVKDNGGATSNEASVSVSIHDAPVAGNDSVQVDAGTSAIFTILSNDTAAPGQALNPGSVAIVTEPTQGTLTVNNDGTVTYFSNPGTAATSDSFTYTVKDATGLTSNIATVSIAIIQPNQP